jgi:ATP-dependent exoDNAse (exonuclease V) alpha subunit
MILTGDTRQHRAVRRGDTLRMLKEHADLALAEVTTVRRQQGPYREAVEAFAEGELYKGFAKLDEMGSCIELPNHERYAAVAQQYLKALEEGKKLHIVSPTHREIRKVNNAIRDALYAQGKLRNAQPVEIFQPLHWNDAQKSDLRMYLPGQVVEMHAAAPHLRAGERVRIVGRERDCLRVLCEDGQTRKFDPSRIPERFEVFQPEEIAIAPGDEIRFTRNGKGRSGELLDNCTTHIVDGFTGGNEIRLTDGTIIPCDFKHLAHGYCGTSYMAQGKTAHRVIVVESQDSFVAGSREQWYVSISRGMDEVLVYTDDREHLFDAVQRSSQRLAALDLEKDVAPSLKHTWPTEPIAKVPTIEQGVAPTADKELAEILKRIMARREAAVKPTELSEELGTKPQVTPQLGERPEHMPSDRDLPHQHRPDLEQEPELELDL